MDTSELDDVLSIVREFVREKVVPLELDIEADDAIPESIIKESAEMGLFGWALPEEYGGLGMNAEQDAQLAMELGYTTPAFRSVFGTNNGIAGQVLVNYGTDEQKSQWLPKLTSGEVVASFALTESEAGSDPSGMRTRAVREGDDYVINGSKRFITNAESSDVLMVFARTDPNAKGSKGISVFLVPTTTEGVTVGTHDNEDGPGRSLDLGDLLRRRPHPRREPHRRRGGEGLLRRDGLPEQGPPAHRRDLRGPGHPHPR